MPLLRRAHLSHIRGGCVLSDLLPTARTGQYRDRHWRRSPSRRTTCNLDNACASAPRWTLWVRSSSSKRTRPDLVLGVSRIPGGHTAGRSMRFSSRGEYDARPSAGHRPRARAERKAAVIGLVARPQCSRRPHRLRGLGRERANCQSSLLTHSVGAECNLAVEDRHVNGDISNRGDGSRCRIGVKNNHIGQLPDFDAAPGRFQEVCVR
jgi:hypothetical protein